MKDSNTIQHTKKRAFVKAFIHKVESHYAISERWKDYGTDKFIKKQWPKAAKYTKGFKPGNKLGSNSRNLTSDKNVHSDMNKNVHSESMTMNNNVHSENNENSLKPLINNALQKLTVFLLTMNVYIYVL